MTPKEKAEELVEKMSYNDFDEDHNCSYYVAKNCALIAVDELIEETQFEVPNIRQRYWQQVKQEINKL